MTPQSKVWVGAWWLAFVFMAAFALILSLTLFAFPSRLPGSEELKSERVSEAHNGSGADQQSFTKLKELPRAVFSLMKNPTLFFLNLAGASEGLVIAGFAAFLPKVIENQFSLTAVWSALVMGVITVPAGGGGTFLGGYLVKRWNLNCTGIIKLCFVVSMVAVVFTGSFLLSCPNLNFAGVTVPYAHQQQQRTPISSVPGEEQLLKRAYDLDSPCNKNCDCSQSHYDPVCGVDNAMYYSPCYAGCGKEADGKQSKFYSDCACINRTVDGGLQPGYDAVNTMCDSTCDRLYWFVALCFFLMLFTFLATMPALSATLRCVHEDQKSFALGIQWLKVRILGTIPAPIIFGRLIDETCILWKESDCEADSGSCLVYDNKYMSR